MNQTFWQERWQAGQIAFHLPTVNPQLARHAGLLPTAPSPVLVPLCGKTQDLAFLADRGHDVWGVEFVEEGARAFFAERAVTPEALRVSGAPAFRAGGVTIVVADFFAFVPPAGLRFAAIYDRAALIAVEPGVRRAYLEKLRALAADDARLLLVTLDYDLPTGPPFSVDAAALAEGTAGLFALSLVDDVDQLAAETRFRERGATRFREQVWLGNVVAP